MEWGPKISEVVLISQQPQEEGRAFEFLTCVVNLCLKDGNHRSISTNIGRRL